MATVKTAISVDQSLFEQADALAKEMRLSRSRLFVLALGDFIRRRQNQELQARLNEAYSGEPDPEQGRWLRGMGRYHREIVENEW